MLTKNRHVEYVNQQKIETVDGLKWIDVEWWSTYQAAKDFLDKTAANNPKVILRVIKKVTQIMAYPSNRPLQPTA